MLDTRTAPYAPLLLRMCLGLLFLIHAAVKLFVFTPAGTAQLFGSVGLPPDLAYLVMAAEVLGGVALILGVWARVAALLLTPILLGAIVMVHAANGFLFNNPNGGWEYPAFWTVCLVALALIGDGPFAILPTPTFGRTPRLQTI